MSTIGIIGYCCHSGLGELNIQLVSKLGIKHWYLIPHPKLAARPIPEGVQVYPLHDVSKFLDAIDIVLFCENPFKPQILLEARAKGKRIVCIPMLEWLPEGPSQWTHLVDLFICPTKQSFDTLQSKFPCYYLPWPIDTDRFVFCQRTQCDSFLFINGNGGYKGRKGGHYITTLLSHIPDLPITIAAQRQVGLPPTVNTINPANNEDLYTHGDVLLVPHTVDGLCLEILEAASCGIPVVSTYGLPWNEYPAIARLRSKVRKVKFGRVIDLYEPKPNQLEFICTSLLGSSLQEFSIAHRKWAESRSWNLLQPELTEGILRGSSK